MKRKYHFKENTFIEPCPKYGNNTRFTVKSEQVAEDCCDIWAVCICGFDPTAEDTMARVEDVWGGVDRDNAEDAIRFAWNEVLQDPNFQPPNNK